MSVPMTISIPGPQAQAFKDRLQEEARRQGISLSEWVVEACADYLRAHDEPRS
jgi:hypothetical protein